MGTRIGIIGVGAIGSVVGGLLTKAGHDVTLIDQWPDHVQAMKHTGLRLSGTCGEHLIPVRALQIHELQSVAEPFDAVFISVKSYDTEWATHLGRNYLKPDGLVVDFAHQIGAGVIIRGLRANADFEYEFEMALMNKHLYPEIETLFMMASQQYLYVSSSRLKELVRLGRDVDEFVPPVVAKRLRERLGRGSR